MGDAHYLRQPALPEVSRSSGAPVACRTRGRASAAALLTTWCSRCPPRIGAIAWQNKAEIYGLLFKAASETMLTIAADPKHLGARIGITLCCTPGDRRSPIIRMCI